MKRFEKRQQIEPYVISIDFDNKVEWINDKSWVIGADIQIGDKLVAQDAFKTPLSFLRKRNDGNINGDFMFVVCSSEFKKYPTENYSVDIDRAYIQAEFDKNDAVEHITNLIDGIGKVSLREFTENIHTFLLTEEWDWLMNNLPE